MSKSSQTQSSTSEQQTLIPGMGPQEQEMVNKLQQVGMSQADALQYVLQQGQKGTGLIGLQGSDQDLLNQAFSGAEAGIRRQADILGQDMAGTRGLNRSDTPVNESVLREMLPMIQQNESAKASQSLGLGLNLQQLRQRNLEVLLGGVNATPSALWNTSQRMQNERFVGAKTIGSSLTKGSRTPSLMDSIGQGMSLTSQGLDLASKIGTMGSAAMAPSPASLGIASSMAASDRRLKSHIVRIGRHRLGIGIYSYKIFGRYTVGVMADEVRMVKPEAVVRHESGYDMVNYGLL